MSQVSLGEGIFLRLTDKESLELFSVLQEIGYDKSSDGVKAFLLDAIRGDVEEKEKSPSPFVQAVKDNPEAVQKTVESVLRFVAGIRKA